VARGRLAKHDPGINSDRLPGSDPPNEQQLEAAVRLLDLLADPTRMKLLWALSVGEYDVSTLTRMAGNSKTSTSQHLAKLREDGLVKVRREGRRAYYQLRGRHIRGLITEVLQQADHIVSDLPSHP
jgi:DNA-binding transcriptional ArsR family regulator